PHRKITDCARCSPPAGGLAAKRLASWPQGDRDTRDAGCTGARATAGRYPDGDGRDGITLKLRLTEMYEPEARAAVSAGTIAAARAIAAASPLSAQSAGLRGVGRGVASTPTRRS